LRQGVTPAHWLSSEKIALEDPVKEVVDAVVIVVDPVCVVVEVVVVVVSVVCVCGVALPG